MEEFVNVLTAFVPAGVVAFIVGVSWFMGNLVWDPLKDKLPRWFLAIPITLGMASGVIHYFTAADLALLSSLPGWRNFLAAIEMGFSYAGASVLIWELKKKIFPGSQQMNVPKG